MTYFFYLLNFIAKSIVKLETFLNINILVLWIKRQSLEMFNIEIFNRAIFKQTERGQFLSLCEYKKIILSNTKKKQILKKFQKSKMLFIKMAFNIFENIVTCNLYIIINCIML